jgi:PAS domain S-box-containing protein
VLFRSLFDLSVPIEIYDQKIGTLNLGMSKYGIRQQVFMTILSVLAVNAAVAIILGLVLFIFFQRSLLRPITSLATAVDQLAQGELNTRVDINAAGEVKMLVDSFNAMANDLQKTTVSRDYVDGIIRSMADTLLVIDPDGTIKTMNAALTGLLGYEEELQGKPLDRLLANGKTEAENLIRLMQQEGWISSIETVYLSRTGKRIPVLISGASLQDKGGTTSGFVLIGKDISERKKAEEKLQSYSLDLLNINEEIKSFANIVSHDLRDPLVNIKGFSEELIQGIREIAPLLEKYLEGFSPDEQRKFNEILKKDIPEALTFIGSSVNRMDSLINSILKLSRAGRRELNPERLSVQGLVGNIVNSLAHQIETRGIRVIAEGLPDVVADKVAMEQIFGNLIDNAIKYLEPGRPGEIFITAAQNDTDLVFHVRDNGRGMAREDIPRAFELFRRVGKQDVPGEGMGLAYVRTLVRLLGGRIWCESRPGEGTTFSFTLPMAVEQQGVFSAPG